MWVAQCGSGSVYLPNMAQVWVSIRSMVVLRVGVEWVADSDVGRAESLDGVYKGKAGRALSTVSQICFFASSTTTSKHCQYKPTCPLSRSPKSSIDVSARVDSASRSLSSVACPLARTSGSLGWSTRTRYGATSRIVLAVTNCYPMIGASPTKGSMGAWCHDLGHRKCLLQWRV
jgi:hypothetical protein